MATKTKNRMQNKREYLLRDGMPYDDSGNHVVGPELLLLSLEKAFSIVHLLEDSEQIRAEYAEVYAGRLQAVRVKRLAEAYVRAGADGEEALEKAKARVLRDEDQSSAQAKHSAKRKREKAAEREERDRVRGRGKQKRKGKEPEGDSGGS